MTKQTPTQSTERPNYDAIVVGAGFAGLNALYNFREAGLDVAGVEMGDDVGGTWYWNRYPGARVDIESLEYSFGFNDDVQQEWQWSLRYSEQPEVLRYLGWVADKLDLRKHIHFGAHVRSAVFDENAVLWTVKTQDGTEFRARYCVLAVGFLSAPYLPDIPGIADFAGSVLHTAAWPKERVTFAAKRIGVIGTGASGVQIVPKLALEAEHLTVFQRTPNWCFPIRNEPISEEYERYVKDNYAEIRRREYEQGGPGIALVNMKMREPETRSALEVSAEARLAAYEYLWNAGGGLLLGTAWTDLRTSLEANNTLREFLEAKIRGRVRDPLLADKLIPTHPAWARRPAGETDYYETFNRDNVTLVATLDDPIVACTRAGIVLASEQEHDLDMIICATGFDAGAGPLLRVEIVGRGGISLTDHWERGVRTHLGMMTTRFPNLFWLNGVQSPSPFFSPPLLADFQTRYILAVMGEVDRAGGAAIEPTVEAETSWGQHLTSTVDGTLLTMANSWWLGANIPGKRRQPVGYPGGFVDYRARCQAAASNGLQEYALHIRTSELGIGRGQ